MNSLTLRVSSRKNREKNDNLVVLPKHYQSSAESYCIQFKEAKTITEQVSSVKKTFENLNSDLEGLKFLTYMFFHCPLKHPVRNQILKLLTNAASLDNDKINEKSIVTALSCSIQRLIEDTKNQPESSIWNTTIASLYSCIKNFSYGEMALEQNILLIFSFLYESVQKYLTKLSGLSSPSERNEYHSYMLTSMRFVPGCISRKPKIFTNDNVNLLEQMDTVCERIISEDQMPMFVRIHSGIFKAQYAKILGVYFHFVKFTKFTIVTNEIACCAGVLYNTTASDFRYISSDIRDVCNTTIRMANANATIPEILQCATIALYNFAEKIILFDLETKIVYDNTKLILRQLLMYTFWYLDHHMETVRHICKDLVHTILATSKKIKFDDLLQKVFESCNLGNNSIMLQCILLQQASTVVGANEIIANCPELFTKLFAIHLGHDLIVNSLFEGLMSASHKELKYDAWFQLWLEYLLQIAIASDDRLPDIENLIEKAVKYEPKIVQRIIEHSDNRIPISTKLSALWVVRTCGNKIDNFNDMVDKFSKHLLLSIISHLDETRIKALRLLVETHKTTELMSAMDCKLITTYLEFNSNCQRPATRHKTVRLLTKALRRCELNLTRVLKEQNSTENNEEPDPSALQLPSPPLYLKFLIDFIKILVSNLFKGANFSRRSTSLQLLEECILICINCNLNFDDMLPKQTISSVVAMLSDSYEANKMYAVKILKLIEDKMDCSLIEQYHIEISLLQMMDLLKSVRPTDSLTAAYQLQFYCNRTTVNYTFGNYELPTYSPTYYSAVRWLVLELKRGLKIANDSILEAAKANPLYGLLFAAKNLINQLNFKILAMELLWRTLIAEFIVLCIELTTVVAPVVNSSSPEGHLPNDFSELPAELIENNEAGKIKEITASKNQTLPCKILATTEEKLDLSNLKTTPQMVLLCAWRTVKEVSLILGNIVLHSPIQFNQLDEQFLVTKEQIVIIGKHFIKLLSETKHRGAFEQAYVGFSKLCCRLWQVKEQDLHLLPMKWLRELIDMISKDEQINEKICATRRSAGVPFMVLSLIVSELVVGSTESLSYCMPLLLQLCATQDRSAESRTHALNIMRAIFRCGDLNEVIGKYVAEGVMCAIRGYDAYGWSERNSATLLFAALITRIFGVQHTKDTENLNTRNKMTGRIFFLRYPELYDFFLHQLQRASELIEQHQRALTLHPLLLILSRLYPSALEGTESNFKTADFIPYILNCAGCPEMQTRYLAAKAVVALVSVDAVQSTILIILSYVFLINSQIRCNDLHGKLLQILLLLKTHNSIDEEIVHDISITFVTVHRKGLVKNSVILAVMLDIFIEIFKSLQSLTFSQNTKDNLLYFALIPNVESAGVCSYYPVLHKSAYIYNLHVLRLTRPSSAIYESLLFLSDKCHAVTHEALRTGLNIILFIFLHTSSITDPEEFEFSASEVQFVTALNTETLHQLEEKLRGSEPLRKLLKKIIQERLDYPECVIKAYAISSFLEPFSYTLSYLIIESKKYPADVKSSLSMCVERAVLNEGIVDSQTSQLCLEYLLEISQPWHPDCLRWKASKILGFIAVHYKTALEKKTLSFIRLYIGLMLSLLMDDDYEIRHNTAQIVLENLNDDIEMHSVVSTMAQRLFLQSTADILITVKADDNYILEIFKIITECSTTVNGRQCTGACSDLEVFDRNETNEFAEPLKAISDAIVVFRNTFGDRAEVLKVINDTKFVKF